MNMISQPVLSSSTSGHGLSISDKFTTPIVSQPPLLNTVGLHDVSYEYLPYIFNSFLNPNNQHHHQNDCNNTSLHHQLIPNNSDILNLNALQIPIFEMIIANRNNKINDSIINNNPMMNMTSVPKNSENNSSFTNFSLTSSLTRAISSNANSIGSQILPICTPLLQLAIRHALAECFPNNIQLHIQGRLEISMNTIDNNNTENPNHINTTTNSSNSSTTTLYFNDTYESQTKSSNFSNENKQEENNNNNNPMCQKLINQQSTTSRRKPLNPSKCYPYDILYNNHYNNEQCENDNQIINNNNSNNNSNNFNLLHVNQSTSPLLSTSSPTSPSSDSGVLDLSHGGSLADSAPITPLKEFQISHSLGISNDKHNSNNSNNITDDYHHYQYFNLHDQLEQYDLHCFNREQDILESYKKQLAAFNQIQAVWKMSTSSTSEKISNSSLKFDPKIKYSDNSNDKQKPNSEPNTPAKIGRRTRTNIGQTGRLTSIRRQSTNRRFPCNQCKEEFPSLHTLEQHTLSQHGTYRCHICQAQFTQRSNLQRHALKHVGFKPFECRVCSKAYYRKDHLMRHMEMGHPGFTPRDNITVHLTSSESLDYLTRSNSLVEIQSIPENYEQQEQQQPMFTDETLIENEYYNDNEHENLDDTNLSPSPINKLHNVDSVYSPIKDEISLPLPEEQIKDSTQTTQ